MPLWSVLGLAACGFPEPIEVVELKGVEVVKLPHWRIDAASVDPGCGDDAEALDCVRTACTIHSLEKEASSAEIVFSLVQKQGTVADRETIDLGPLETRQLDHAFPGARLGSAGAMGRCDLVQTGSRVVCRVINNGEQPHLVDVVARLTDATDAPSAEQDAVLELKAGEARDVRFAFDHQNASGACEVAEPNR